MNHLYPSLKNMRDIAAKEFNVDILAKNHWSAIARYAVMDYAHKMNFGYTTIARFFGRNRIDIGYASERVLDILLTDKVWASCYWRFVEEYEASVDKENILEDIIV